MAKFDVILMSFDEPLSPEAIVVIRQRYFPTEDPLVVHDSLDAVKVLNANLPDGIELIAVPTVSPSYRLGIDLAGTTRITQRAVCAHAMDLLNGHREALESVFGALGAIARRYFSKAAPSKQVATVEPLPLVTFAEPLGGSSSELSKERWAVLVDAENVGPSYIDGILTLMGQHGTVIAKKAFGDFSHVSLGVWRETCIEKGLTAIHAFRCVKGKSNSDMTLALDAMDWLHSGQVDGICIVSSDSDFTPLALRIRASGLKVFAIGQSSTSPLYQTSVDRFIPVDDLREALTNPRTSAPRPRAQPKGKKDNIAAWMPVTITPANLNVMLARMTNACSNDEGWARMTTVGSALSSKAPGFKCETHGVTKLKYLFEKCGFEKHWDEKEWWVRAPPSAVV